MSLLIYQLITVQLSRQRRGKMRHNFKVKFINHPLLNEEGISFYYSCGAFKTTDLNVLSFLSCSIYYYFSLLRSMVSHTKQTSKNKTILKLNSLANALYATYEDIANNLRCSIVSFHLFFVIFDLL